MNEAKKPRSASRHDREPHVSRDEVGQVVVGGVAVLLFATVLLLSYLGVTPQTVTTGYRINATFNRVDGLSPGADVQVAGVPVGRVESASLSEDFRASVALRIADPVRLPKDTSAAIHTDGLFGEKFVVLEPGGDEDYLQEGDGIVFTQDSVVVSELLELIIAEGRSRQATESPAAMPAAPPSPAPEPDLEEPDLEEEPR